MRYLGYFLLLCTCITFAQKGFELNHNSRDYDQIHIKLYLDFDFGKKTVNGISEYTFTPLKQEFSTLILHSKTTNVKSVRLAGKKLNHKSDDEYLKIEMNKKYSPQDTLTIVIEYISFPRRGLYFFSPDKDYPNMPYQIWTQGQSNYNRYWYPAYDLPDDKLTSEIILTVPEKLKASSNGLLQSVTPSGKGNMRFHWKMDKPYSNYLTSVVVGEYDIMTETVENTILEHYMAPEWPARNYAHIYGRTANMLQFFNQLILPYPYQRYAQIPVQDFEWGGMENITATTLNKRINHDNCIKPNYSADGLIAHELAHQWYGDLLTCRDWNHLWLNEGFATYYTTLWEEHYLGYDAYIASHILTQKDYTGQWLTNIQTATDSTKTARIPVDLSGGNAYDKGASILNMIRFELGKEQYNKVIKAYTEKYMHQNVVSDQFRDMLPKVSSVSWEKFFDQWVYGTGYPELNIKYVYDAPGKKINVTIEQTPVFGSSEQSFIFNLPVEVYTNSGVRSVIIPVKGQYTNYEIPADSRPFGVGFNSNSAILCTYETNASFDDLVYMLKYSNDAAIRLYAGSQLHKFDSRGTEHLAYALKNETNWLVKKEILLSLDKINTIESLRAMYAAFADHDGRVREAAARSMAAFKMIVDNNQEAGNITALLKNQLAKDCNHYVRGAVLETYGKLALPDFESLLMNHALEVSHLDAVRKGVFAGLRSVSTDALFDLALKALDYNIATGDMHLGDIEVLEWASRHYKDKAGRVKEVIKAGLKNPYFRTRIRAAKLIDELEIKDLVPYLREIRNSEIRIVVNETLDAVLTKMERKS